MEILLLVIIVAILVAANPEPALKVAAVGIVITIELAFWALVLAVIALAVLALFALASFLLG